MPYFDDPEPFSFKLNSNGVLLKWETTQEEEVEGYYIERAVWESESGSLDWNNIGFVKGNGNSNRTTKYEFQDDNVENFNKYHYRLKQVHFDGEPKFYDLYSIVNVYPFRKTQFFPTYPNPVADTFYISYYLNEKDFVQLIFH
jgi:hypothetical protein